MSAPKVLVSGSGIAGSSFAFWLLKAFPQAQITMIERSASFRTTGAAVDVRSNAVDIIKKMGIEPAVRAAHTGETGMKLVNRHGATLLAFSATGNAESQSITSEYEIMRGTLGKIILDATVTRIKEIIFGDYVQSLEQDDKGVTVHLANSRRRERFDYVIAADGAYSKIRGMILNTSPLKQVHDQGQHVGIFSIKEDILHGSKIAQATLAPNGSLVIVRPDPRPETYSCIMMSKTHAGQDAEKAILNDAVKQGNDAYKQLIQKRFADMGWIVPQVLQHLKENSDDFYCSSWPQVRSPILQKGRVVLVGDAGHATSGVGTSLAIMGGYILAGELLSCNGDVHAAARRYEEILLPFAKSFQRDGPSLGFLFPNRPWAILLRDTFLRIITFLHLPQLLISVAQRLPFGGDDRIALPDYQWPA